MSQAEHSQASVFTVHNVKLLAAILHSLGFSFFSCRSRTTPCPKLQRWLLRLISWALLTQTPSQQLFWSTQSWQGENGCWQELRRLPLVPGPPFSFCLGSETKHLMLFQTLFCLKASIWIGCSLQANFQTINASAPSWRRHPAKAGGYSTNRPWQPNIPLPFRGSSDSATGTCKKSDKHGAALKTVPKPFLFSPTLQLRTLVNQFDQSKKKTSAVKLKSTWRFGKILQLYYGNSTSASILKLRTSCCPGDTNKPLEFKNHYEVPLPNSIVFYRQLRCSPCFHCTQYTYTFNTHVECSKVLL